MNYQPVQTTPYNFSYKLKSRFWNLINATIFRWTPFFMRRTRVAMLKLFGANIEWNCSINPEAEINYLNYTQGMEIDILKYSNNGTLGLFGFNDELVYDIISNI